MKIIQVHNYYQQAGGEDAVVAAEYELLHEHGHEVVRYYKDNSSLVGGLQLVVSSIKTVWNWETYREFRKLLKTEKPDVVHCHNTFPLISPSIYWACAKEKVPVVQTIHNFRMICASPFLYRDCHICELCVGKRFPYPAVVYRCYRNNRAGSLIWACMVFVHRLIGTWSKKVTAYIALTEFQKNKMIEGGLPENKVRVKPNFIQTTPKDRESSTEYTEKEANHERHEKEDSLSDASAGSACDKNNIEEDVSHRDNGDSGEEPDAQRLMPNAFSPSDIPAGSVCDKNSVEEDVSHGDSGANREAKNSGISTGSACNRNNVEEDVSHRDSGGSREDDTGNQTSDSSVGSVCDDSQTSREAGLETCDSNEHPGEANFKLKTPYCLMPSASQRYALFVGRLSPEKGCDVLIRAWHHFTANYQPQTPNSAVPQLLIVGDGPERVALLALSSVLQTTNSKPQTIHFLGHRSKNDVRYLMHNALFLVFPSVWYETFGLTVLEAGMEKVPSIISANTTTSGLVQDGQTGQLFPMGDEDVLAEKIAWAFEHPEEMQAMGARAYKVFKMGYSAEMNYRQLAEIYQQCVDSVAT